MQAFIDSVTQKIWHFEQDVQVSAAAGVYTFKTAPGVPLKTPKTLQPYSPPAPTAGDVLAAAQATQNAVLSRACAQVILGGFNSSALGAPHSYGSAAQDQANLTAAAVAAANAASGWETPCWCAGADGAWALVQHTGAQIIQVHSDCLSMISATRERLAALKTEVATATTVAAVQAVIW